MTFTEAATEIAERCGLTATASITRIGKRINRVHREVTTKIGMTDARREIASKVVTIANRYVEFTDVEKLRTVYYLDDDSNPVVLTEISFDEMKTVVAAASDAPTQWARAALTTTSVTILIDAPPETAYTLYADADDATATLTTTNTFIIPESFHDIIVDKVVAEELERKSDYAGADRAASRAEKRMGELLLYIASSGTRIVRANDTYVPRWMRRR